MADRCLYYSYTMTGPIIWLTCMNYCLIAGNEDLLRMKQLLDCDDLGELTKCMGCEID